VSKIAQAFSRLVGLKARLTAQTVSFDLLTKSGIFTGEEMKAIEISNEDWRRIQVFLIRVVRGLYYFFKDGKDKYDHHIYSVVDYESSDGKKILAPDTELFNLARDARTNNIVDGRVLKAVIVPIQNTDNEHVWILNFYNRKTFCILSIQEERHGSIAGHIPIIGS